MAPSQSTRRRAFQPAKSLAPDLPVVPSKVAEFLRLFIDSGQVTELRAFESRGRAHIGFFDADHLDVMAKAAADLEWSCRGVYFVPNPVNPKLLNRAKN